MKNTGPKNVCVTVTRSFISCCFILAFKSADIIFPKFLEFHSILSTNFWNFIQHYQIFFQPIHSAPILRYRHHPISDQNLLSMMTGFCQCSLIFFRDQTSNAPNGTKTHNNIMSL